MVNPFTEGQKVTMIGIDSMMAMCHRKEITVKGVLDEPKQVGYQQQTTRYGVYAQRKKRKKFYLDSRPSSMIFLNGWDLPIRVDTDLRVGIMRGNACFNLIGDPETLKALLDGSIIPVTDQQKAQVVLCGLDRTCGDDSADTLLYPEIQTGHAVINRMKERVTS